MSIFLFILFVLFLYIIIPNTDAVDIYSFLEINKVDLNIPTPFAVQFEIEYIYHRSSIYNETNDPVCELSVEKKIALCQIIFNLFEYEYIDIHLNKVPFYMNNLQCQENQLSFKYTLGLHNDERIYQNMYPCFGRHGITHTSFIEDDLYSVYYVSNGPEIDSVIVYNNEINDSVSSFYIHNIVYNIDLSKLENKFITVKDVLEELKLNRRFISTIETEKIEKIYSREQNYWQNARDPICELEYERKISLCKIIYDDFLYKEALKITVNLSAFYVFNTSCIKRPVYYLKQDSDYTMKKLLNDDQKLYSCYARHRHKNPKNFLTSKYLLSFFMSRGPRKNSIIIYVYSEPERNKSLLSIFQMVENVDLKIIRPTLITDKDIIEESSSTFIEIEKIVNTIKEQYEDRLVHMLIFNEKEEELIQEMIDVSESELYNMKENAANQTLTESKSALSETVGVGKTNEVSDQQIKSVEDKNKLITLSEKETQDHLKYTMEKYYREQRIEQGKTVDKNVIVDVIYNTADSKIEKMTDFRHVQLGPQVFKRLLNSMKTANARLVVVEKKKGNKIKKKNITQYKLDKSDEKIIRDEKLNEEVRALVHNMRLFIVKKKVEEALLKRESETVNSGIQIIPRSQGTSTKEQEQEKYNKNKR